MLVLQRRIGSSLQIGEAKVEILSRKGDKISIGITAPKHVGISRDEAGEAPTPPAAPAVDDERELIDLFFSQPEGHSGVIPWFTASSVRHFAADLREHGLREGYRLGFEAGQTAKT